MAAKITAALFAAVLLSAFLLIYSTQASAPPGLPASQRMATTTQVGPQENITLFSANTLCTARIIRTQDEPIYLLFADPVNGDTASTSLTANAGFHQASSTTVAYDSGLYGCGRVTAEAAASTTITISEMQ